MDLAFLRAIALFRLRRYLIADIFYLFILKSAREPRKEISRMRIGATKYGYVFDYNNVRGTMESPRARALCERILNYRDFNKSPAESPIRRVAVKITARKNIVSRTEQDKYCSFPSLSLLQENVAEVSFPGAHRARSRYSPSASAASRPRPFTPTLAALTTLPFLSQDERLFFHHHRPRPLCPSSPPLPFSPFSSMSGQSTGISRGPAICAGCQGKQIFSMSKLARKPL